jgi:hypothetical protein
MSKRAVNGKSIGAAIKRDPVPRIGYAKPLLPPRAYECVVLAAKRTTSRTGNPMVKIILGAWDASGSVHEIPVYFGSWDEKWFPAKTLECFCRAAGLGEQCWRGSDPSELIGARVLCIIDVEPANDKYPYRSNCLVGCSPSATANAAKISEAPAGSESDVPW